MRQNLVAFVLKFGLITFSFELNLIKFPLGLGWFSIILR